MIGSKVMKQNANEVTNSLSFLYQSVFASSIHSSMGSSCNFVKRKCLPELKISAQSLAQERKGKQSVQKRSRYISTVDIQHSTSSSTRNVRITQNIHAFSWGYVVKKNLDDISSGKSGGISVY